MIITCNNCSKKFDVDSKVIPEKGRLLQCNGCNHKWFFKKENKNEHLTPSTINKPKEMGIFNEDAEFVKIENSETIELLDSSIKESVIIKKNSKNSEDIKSKTKKFKNEVNLNILPLIIVFIISFIALIIIVDTFKSPIGKIVPSIEYLLYNLYETIKDIILFLSDLI